MKTINDPVHGTHAGQYATVPATSDAKEYLRLLGRHKFGLLLTLLLGLLLAWLYLISTDKVYETSSLLQVNEVEGPLNDNTGQVVDWNPPSIREETNLLRSRRVLAPVVDAYGLRIQATERRLPVLGDLTRELPWLGDFVAGTGLLSHVAWGDADIEVAELDVPRALEDKPLVLSVVDEGAFSLAHKDRILIDRAEVGQRMRIDMGNGEILSILVNRLDAPAGVEYDLVKGSMNTTVADMQKAMATETTESNSRMIALKLRGKDPVKIADMANSIIKEYEVVKLGSQNREVESELRFFEERLPQVEAELRDAEQRLAEFRLNRNSVNQEEQNLLKLRQIDKLETELLDLEVELADYLKRYTIEHPTPKRVQKEIDVYNAKLTQLRGQLVSAPNTERELTILEQDVDSKRLLYTEMSEDLQKLRVQIDGAIGPIQVIDNALVPQKPVSPNPLLAIVGGMLATTFLYLLWLTLRSALSTTINDQHDLERASGLPVYMNVPKSSAQKRLPSAAPLDSRRLLPGRKGDDDPDRTSKAVASTVLALSKPEDYSIENLRGLRSMLDDLMSSADNNVLMFTSPLPGMGKSFLSLNLAVLVAQSSKRVLLIDADYQRGQLHKSLGLDTGPGLPEVVSGRSELKQTVRATTVPNLYCIPRGFGGNGFQMPSDKEFAAFVDVVAPRFDIVIVDTPPVLSVSTAATLGKHVGSTIMVVREGEVKEPQLNEALKRLGYSGVRVSGCIMNGTSAPTPGHFNYYREALD
ncbi:MAG: hypothetical protein CSB44_09715 [Gammaproteobacteria bacterium]|nr:MAG: hypothetical protein CSB44_09715 [Gammaproteobacteria bacterium]